MQVGLLLAQHLNVDPLALDHGRQTPLKLAVAQRHTEVRQAFPSFAVRFD
jgi:hypothetical protein